MFTHDEIQKYFKYPVQLRGNLIDIGEIQSQHIDANQEQTKDIFSVKWKEVDELAEKEKFQETQYKWFLDLYGFASEDELAKFLKTKKVIIDTGCGMGYKAAWFARLAPESLVFGIDISDSVIQATQTYRSCQNLFFLQGDIGNTPFKDDSIDFVVCDQVLMHTEVPEMTFAHLATITKNGGEFACYVYRKKALPRELIDDYFRSQTHHIEDKDMWEFSSQLTEFGKRLSDLNVSFDCPDIPALGIKGGKYDIQRFIYWNFLKCYWNPEWGFELSKSTNYDWYAPSNAKRFSKEEFEKMIEANYLSVTFFHEEEACYSGRFRKKN